VTFVLAFAGGGADGVGGAGGGGVAGAGAGIEGNFGGPGTTGKVFVEGPGGGRTLAGRDKLGRGGGLGKPVSGRGATVGGRPDGVTFAPAGEGTLLPAGGFAVGGFGGAGGSLGGMKSVLPMGIQGQPHRSSTLRLREEF